MKKYFQLEKMQTMSGYLLLVLMSYNLYNIFIFVPTEKTMGIVQRIFYFHVPSGIAAFLAFFVVAGYSIAFLKTRNRSALYEFLLKEGNVILKTDSEALREGFYAYIHNLINLYNPEIT